MTDWKHQWYMAPLRLIFSPGYLAVSLYRVGHHLPLKPITGPLIKRIQLLLTGCEISVHAQIGRNFRLDHCQATSIGRGVVIGDNVSIHRAVGIGQKNGDHYPIIEDDVTIYPGAEVVGACRIGRGSIIGANAYVDFDVPPGSKVYGPKAVII